MSEYHPNTIYYGRITSSPAGPLWAAVTDRGLYSIEFDKPEAEFLQILKKRAPHAIISKDEICIKTTRQQINEYFQGDRQAFDLVIDMHGIHAFQQAALKATLAIPYGQTATYTDIAETIGHPGAARAVGRAEATNPISLVIPCHRVVGSDGKLHGYGGPGGIKLKAKLLELELSNR